MHVHKQVHKYKQARAKQAARLLYKQPMQQAENRNSGQVGTGTRPFIYLITWLPIYIQYMIHSIPNTYFRPWHKIKVIRYTIVIPQKVGPL